MTRLQNPRTWLIGGGVLALLIVVIGYFAFIGPQRDETAGVRTSVADAQGQSDVLQQRLVHLAKQNQDLGKFQAALAQARLALPATSAMPEFLQSLQTISNTTHTSLTGLTVGTPTAMTQSAAPTGATSSAAPATAGAPTGVYSVAISAQVAGPRVNLAEFLRELQSVQPRAVLITSMTEGSATGVVGDTSASTLSLTMQAFVSPASAPQTAQPSATPSSGG